MDEEDSVARVEVRRKVEAAEAAAARAGFEREDVEHAQALRRERNNGKAWDAADLLIAALLQGEMHVEASRLF